jgi:ketosteroid isomerase-like protein
MISIQRPLAILLFTLVCMPTSFAAQEPNRSALETATQRWSTALNAQDVETLTTLMTDDVELLDATATTVTGREPVMKVLREAARRGQLVATSREITIVGEVAWRVVALTQTQSNGDVLARGQALEIWKRVQGQWKLHRQMAAGIVAPADALSRPSPVEPVMDRPRN